MFTPGLTEIGERAHLTSPTVDLSTHVRDVVIYVLYKDRRGFALVAFSYGGLVATGALEHVADRIRHLGYPDAFVSKNGESVLLTRTAFRAPARTKVQEKRAG